MEDQLHDQEEVPPLSEEEIDNIQNVLEHRAQRLKVFCDHCGVEVQVPAGSCYTCWNCHEQSGGCG